MLKFFDMGDWSQLEEISVWTDSSGVRSMQVTVVKDDRSAADAVSVMMFGYGPGTNDKTTYPFWEGKQLMGFVAKEEADWQYNVGNLLSLSVY